MIQMTRTVGRHLGVLELQVRRTIRDRIIDDRGEGVISMAIAILIIATIGAVMYTLFLGTGEGLNEKVEEQILEIGGDG